MTVRGLALERLGDSDLELAEGERDIRNMKVVDADGNELGTVTGLYVDLGERAVRFLMVRGGGILGIGDRELLIPADAIRSVHDVVRLGHSHLQVAQSPRYQPDLVDKRWYWEGMYGWYGYPPFWAGPMVGRRPVPPPDGRKAVNDDQE